MFFISLKSSEDPTNAFYVGQVVTCVVTSCSPVKQRLSLSFNVSFSKFTVYFLFDVICYERAMSDKSVRRGRKGLLFVDDVEENRPITGAGADQFSSDRRVADFPGGMHWCATKKLTEHCSSSTTVVGYDLVVSHTKLLLSTVLHLAF